MAEKIKIEIEAEFSAKGLDNLTQKVAQAEKGMENLKKTSESVGKNGGSNKPFDAMEKSASKAEQAVKKVKTATDKLAKTKADVNITAKDKASTVISRITSKLKPFAGGKVYNAMIAAKDSASNVINNVMGLARRYSASRMNADITANDRASRVISSVSSGLKNIVGKTWNVVISAKDNVTGFIRGITNKLFSLKTLVAGIMGGMAMNTFALKPIALADKMETSFVSFETMLGSGSEASKMMDNIKDFARTTPLDTSGVIDSVRTMLTSGAWNKDNVMDAAKKIGNAAMASGGGTEAMKGITLAMSQMSMTGRVNAQDMMQLANRGIPAWQMLADYFKKSVSEVRDMSKDGEISAEQGIEAIMQGLSRYDGMMDKLSKRTAGGIWSNIKDTFELSIVEKWGRGLQSGAIDGLSKFAGWLDRISPKLEAAGASLEKIGSKISSTVFDKLEKIWTRAEEILDSDDFKLAEGIGGKMKVLFGTLFKDAWTAFKGWLSEKAPDIGRFIGTGLKKGIIGIADFITGALGGDTSGVDNLASDIGSSFWQAFCDAFDGDMVWTAVKRAIGAVFSSAGKLLPGGESATLSSWISAGLITKFMASTGLGSLAIGGASKLGGFGLRKLLSVPKGGSLLGNFAMMEGAGATSNLVAYGGQSLAQAFPHLAYGGNGLIGLAGKAGVGMRSVAAGAKGFGLLGGKFAGVTSAGGLALAGTAGIAGALAGAASTVKGISDLVAAGKARKEGNTVEAGAKTRSGASALGGVAAGAAIGTLILPGLGTAIGAGIGGIAGWVGGNKWAKDYREMNKSVEQTDALIEFAGQRGISVDKAANLGTYSTERMKKAIQDTTLSAAELGEEFEKAVTEDMRSRFGEVSLSLEDIDEMAKKITFGENIKALEQFMNASEESTQTLSSLSDAMTSLEKWNLKAKVGIEVTGEEDIDAFVADVDSYVHYAKQYIEDLQFESVAALNVLMNVETEEGKKISDKTNSFYKGLQDEISALEKQLADEITKAKADGKIGIRVEGDGTVVNENEIIQNLTNQIDSILREYESFKANAKLDLIDLQFGNGQMTADNFKDFQAAIGEYMEQVGATENEAYITAKATLDWQLSRGHITQEEYDAAIAEAERGWQEAMNNRAIEVNAKQIKIASESYDDLFGDDAQKCADAFQNALNTALNDWHIDPIKWSTEDLAAQLGLTSLGEEEAQQIREILSNIFNNQPVKINPKLEIGQYVDEAGNVVAEGLQFNPAPQTVELPITVNPTVTTITKDDVLSLGKGPLSEAGVKSALGLDTPLSITSSATATYEVDHMVGNQPTSEELTSQITVPEISMNGKATLHMEYSVGNQPTISFADGFVVASANGRIATKPMLSTLAEEGWPEAVIPFNPARRQRALGLWEETGRRLGVLSNANGGIVGETVTENPYNPPAAEVNVGSSHSGGQVSVKMEKGSVQINISADSSQTVSEAIESQKEEIAEKISGIISKALGAQFANMPVKVSL